MLRTPHKIITGLIVALGVLHVGLTPFDHDKLSVEAIFFAGAGVAIILAGLINFILLRDAGGDGTVRALCVATNAALALLFGVSLLVLPEPQVFLGLALFAAATVIALVAHRTRRE